MTSAATKDARMTADGITSRRKDCGSRARHCRRNVVSNGASATVHSIVCADSSATQKRNAPELAKSRVG